MVSGISYSSLKSALKKPKSVTNRNKNFESLDNETSPVEFTPIVQFQVTLDQAQATVELD